MAYQGNLLSKTLVIGIIFLFVVMSINPTIGLSTNDDTTPPVTTHTLDPPEPDGDNDWYVNDVNVTLKATDDMSGVKEIHYRVAEGEWKNHTGDFLIIVLDYDCLIDGLIEFYAVDFVGNQEETKSVSGIKIDQLPPEINFTYKITGGNELTGWDIRFTVETMDDCSSVFCVEFLLNGVLQDTIFGDGPQYCWGFHLAYECSIIGFICNKNVTEENISFYAIIVRTKLHYLNIIISVHAYDEAGNRAIANHSFHELPTHGFYKFQRLTIPNKYKGYIGRFFILARFDIW